MAALELLIPPPVVALIVAAAMWGVSLIAPSFEPTSSIRLASAAALAVVGVSFDLAGVISFLRARTTINPMKPARSSALVCSGVYRVTRNPMYLGLLFILVAWAVFLSSVWALFGALAFVLYMNRFQIVPEERVLLATFGDSYSAYTSKVRRWL